MGAIGAAAATIPFLHFEVCYYRAIDFAIEHGLRRVEAGAQGQHKIQRGYLPPPTYSAHWIRDPGFARAVADFSTASAGRSRARWKSSRKGCRRSGARQIEAADYPSAADCGPVFVRPNVGARVPYGRR